jgi:hypothetical protein
LSFTSSTEKRKVNGENFSKGKNWFSNTEEAAVGLTDVVPFY